MFPTTAFLPVSALSMLSDVNHVLTSFVKRNNDKGCGDHVRSLSTSLVLSKDGSQIEEPTSKDFTLVVADRPSRWNHVANLRYDEWIEDKFSTSQEAFRLATLEICEERCAQGATIVLAVDVQSSEVLGAAEASPIEIKDAQLLTKDESYEVIDLYLTDVVTAASHRRKGVARFLVQALEAKADCLWLHVTSDNLPAQNFYESMGYERYSFAQQDSRIDAGKLEEVTGSTGQVLMWKDNLR